MFTNEIEIKRKNLIKTAKKYGINSDQTIQCSQELDMLLLQEILGSNKHLINDDKQVKEYI
ncbi:aspartyl-phosphate phosphatase Spo0E family protein [Metabacillus endolithicus]|uniref:Aspartyl-phosphate phosphatase Spo0E family protein n=1 Tax=Metabacillus endolithicus TaxID=1535204 RepID=A0ABW5C205_9BACI|nr:aspartyl-phosphate phosphatase Spo0E family protein [Metabacillus endolithicus]UPG62340.1 aspartyl-phosphate phosphatase Spo0E family protein [Metabacillus endolithicus]